jgi:outer membrane lipoprotein-sorting protein
MNKLIIFSLLFISIFTNVQGQVAGFKPIADEPAFRKKFSEYAKGIQTIKSQFIQEKNLNVLSEKIISRGLFMFKKTNLVRMEYTHPFKYLLVINKDKITIRDAQKTNSFSSKSNKLFDHINRIIIDCMQGTAVDNKDFKSQVFENEKQYLMVLKPQNKNLTQFFSSINIYIERKDNSINKIDMIESTGDNTVITFQNKLYNIDIPDAEFVVN